MKKVFQTKLRSLTKVLTLVIIASLATFTGCTSYDEDITDLQGQIDKVVTDVATLKTSVAALQASVNGMTYIKSITMGTDGKLTITPSTGTAIVYDAKNYVTYDIALVNNVLTVNGVNKGTVAIPALTFGADNKLMSGTTVVADLSSWVRTLTLSSDNYLMINGVKSTILIPAATVQSVDVKGITISGNVLTITKNDNSTSTITLPQTALTLTAVSSNNGELTLNLNGVDTKVTIKNTYGIDGGFLTVNGVKTTVAIPAENKTSVIFSKVDGVIVSATISDGKDTMVVKLNPSTELLEGIIFSPTIIDGGVNTVDLGYILTASGTPVKVLHQSIDLNFRFNPSSANLAGTTWSFIANSATFRAPSAGVPGDVPNLFVQPKFTDLNGSGTFTMKANSDIWSGISSADVKRIVSLQATSKDFYDNTKTKVVTSDYIKVLPQQYNALITKTGTAFASFVTAKPLYNATADYTLYYDGGASLTTFDCKTAVIAAGKSTAVGSVTNTLKALGFGDLDVDYYFDYNIDSISIPGADGVTNQNSFVQLSNGVLTVKQGAATINRNPVVRVRLLKKVSSGIIPVLATAYIKFDIEAPTEEAQAPVTYTKTESAQIAYESLFKKATSGVFNDLSKTISIDWVSMNNEVYNKIGKVGLTHNQFRDLYGDTNKATVTITATNPSLITVGNPTGLYSAADVRKAFKFTVSNQGADYDTYAMTLAISPYVKFGTTTVSYVYTPVDTKKAKVTINFVFTVKAPTLTYVQNPSYVYLEGAKVQGMVVGGNYKQQVFIGELFSFGNSTNLRDIFGIEDNQVDSAKHEINIVDNYRNAVTPAKDSYVMTGYTAPTDKNTINDILGTSNQTGPLMSTNPDNVIDIPVRIYPVTFKSTYPNGEVATYSYKLYFINPLAITSLGDIILKDKSAGDSRDLSIAPVQYKVTDQGVDVTNPILAYSLVVNQKPGTNPAQLWPLSLTGSTIKFEDSGTRLTSDIVAGTVSVKYVTSYAKLTVSDKVIVQSTAQGIKRK